MDLLFLTRLAGVDLRTSESFDCEECFGHGPFQKRMLFLILLGAFTTHCQTLVVSLVTGDVDHWCKPPSGLNISADDWKHIAIPKEADGRFSRCRVYERCKPLTEHGTLVDREDVDAAAPSAESLYNQCLSDQVQDINSTSDVPCEAWDYGVRTADSSAVSSWNMVCDRRLMRVVLVSMQSSGSVVGLVVVGVFADYIGRRTLLLGSAIALLACTVLLMAVLGLALCEVWTVVTNPVVIDWRLKQIIFLAPTALLLPALFFARESPRWLVARGRLDDAEAIMMRAATINNFPLPATACFVEKLKEHVQEPRGL
ncbi:hypothetical protein MTO96_048911 [Rhipicephalus appendiculatus]